MDELSGSAAVDAYISRFSPETQAILRSIRDAVREAAPEASEKISYQMPTFFYYGNLVHFAAFEKHIGFYPTPSGIETFSKELSAYKTSKGAVQFPIEKPVPLELIREITAFRVRENAQAEAAKRAARPPHSPISPI